MLNKGKRNTVGILIDAVDYEVATDFVQRAAREKRAKYVDDHRRGYHIWWIRDLQHYPGWKLQFNVPRILSEIYEVNVERWTEGAVGRHQSRPGRHGTVPAIY